MAGDIDSESTRRIGWKRALVSVVFALLIGYMAALDASQFWYSGPVFVVGCLAAFIYLYRKPIATKSAAFGFFTLACVTLLYPFLFYMPRILEDTPEDAGAAETVGTFTGNVLGFFLWGVLFAAVALILFIIGYFVNKRANKKLDAAE